MDRALAGEPLRETFAEFCGRVRAAGLPLDRAHVSVATLHPMIRALSTSWRPEEGVENTEILRTDEAAEGWLRSPLRKMLEIDRAPEARYDLSQTDHGFPVFDQLRAEGVQDYIALIHGFTAVENAFRKRDGMISSWATHRSGGFTPQEVKTIRRLVSRLAVAVKLETRDLTIRNILSAYLGPQTGERVLEGHIQLGDVETIEAVIWYADMVGSTPLAASLGPEAYMAHLNRYFAATAGSVIAEGGEVLRFIGDAVLAIFRIEDGHGPAAAAAAALRAARLADRAVAAANAAGEGPPIRWGLGLHVGAVQYGNIGVPERVEFSVIGPAANEVARIEGLTRDFGETVLVSGPFVDHVADRSLFRDLGARNLRGVAAPMPVYALDLMTTVRETSQPVS